MAQLAPFLNEAEPVHGDLETLEVLVADQVVSMHTHDSFTIKVVAPYPALGAYNDNNYVLLQRLKHGYCKSRIFRIKNIS